MTDSDGVIRLEVLPRGGLERVRRDIEAATFQGGGGGGDRDTDELIDPKAPLETSRRYIATSCTVDDRRTLHHWRGDFYRWDGRCHRVDGCYRMLDELEQRNALYLWLEGSRKAAGGGTAPCHPNQRFVNNVLDALKAAAALAKDIEPPTWLGPVADQPPASEFVAVANGLLHLPTRELWPPTPAYFTPTICPVAYDENAPPPARWLRFLTELWPNDPQAIDTLGEWFGYCLSADTSQQKILMINGPKRSGKGTLARVMTGVLGAANVCNPTFAGLGGNFGLEPLIGKRLAIISDARLSRRSDQAVITERLLTVSGEDSATIDRKHQAAWNGRLRTRFMVLTNELPSLSDISGALASRLILLPLTESFEGREDPELTGALLAELPGTLKWAIDGWHRLRAHGRFVQPESGTDAMRVLHDLASPMNAFVSEHCRIGAAWEVDSDQLHQTYVAWREAQGLDGKVSKQRFGRDLRAVCPGVRVKQPRVDGLDRQRVYAGIGLLTPNPQP